MKKNPQDDGPRLKLTDLEVTAVALRINHHRNNFHLLHEGAAPMTQDALASGVGIPRPTLASYLKGHRQWPVKVLQDVAFVLDVAPEAIDHRARRVFTADAVELQAVAA